jgi:hypothetical protein
MMRTVIGMLSLGIALVVPRVATAQNEQVFYYHLDAVGSVRAITDEANQIVERHDYLPFGEAPPGEPAGQDARRVAGKERDCSISRRRLAIPSNGIVMHTSVTIR